MAISTIEFDRETLSPLLSVELDRDREWNPITYAQYKEACEWVGGDIGLLDLLRQAKRDPDFAPADGDSILLARDGDKGRILYAASLFAEPVEDENAIPGIILVVGDYRIPCNPTNEGKILCGTMVGSFVDVSARLANGDALNKVYVKFKCESGIRYQIPLRFTSEFLDEDPDADGVAEITAGGLLYTVLKPAGSGSSVTYMKLKDLALGEYAVYGFSSQESDRYGKQWNIHLDKGVRVKANFRLSTLIGKISSAWNQAFQGGKIATLEVKSKTPLDETRTMVDASLWFRAPNNARLPGSKDDALTIEARAVPVKSALAIAGSEEDIPF